MTMKRGGWGVRCGTRARLAAEESLPGIGSCDHGSAGINKGIIAASRPVSSRRFAMRLVGGTRWGKNGKMFSDFRPHNGVFEQGQRKGCMWVLIGMDRKDMRHLQPC